MPRRIVTLTTDFGTRDGFVAAMKAVIFSIAKEVEIVDVSHQVEAGNIREATFVLSNVTKYFPKGTIHVAVVDPGVGSKRRPIAVKTKDALFIGPDNGIFTPWLDKGEVFHLDRNKYFLKEISRTFHGRDVFAPAAAHAANGVAITKMGTRIDDPVKIKIVKPTVGKDGVVGEVVHVDRFGNLITNVPGKLIGEKCVVKIAGKTIAGLSECYDVKGKKFIAIIGSHGNVEIAAPTKRASDVLKVGVGARVEIKLK